MIVIVQKIIKDSKVFSSIDIEDLKIVDLEGPVLIIKTEKDFIVWTGEYGYIITLVGGFCTQISSKVDNEGNLYYLKKNVTDSLGVLKMYQDCNQDFFSKTKAVVNPYLSVDDFKFFEISINLNQNLLNKVECLFCPKKMIERKKMRLHIGIHMLHNLIPINPTTCGFCGIMGCSLNFEKNVAGKNSPLCPLSNCIYFQKFSLKAAEKSTTNSPCTNRPVECVICKLIIWSYNIKIHYDRIHTGIQIPFMISDDEKKRIKALNI